MLEIVMEDTWVGCGDTWHTGGGQEVEVLVYVQWHQGSMVLLITQLVLTVCQALRLLGTYLIALSFYR